MPKFSSNICNEHKAIYCDLCNMWVHTKCNKINIASYNMLPNDETKCCCIECSKESSQL